MMDHTQIIEDTLRQLGVGGNYIACHPKRRGKKRAYTLRSVKKRRWV